MTQFTITGDLDPFLHVGLENTEKIYCDANSMVMMEGNLELKGKVTSGSGSLRRFSNGESFYQQHIEATYGPGDCLLAPTFPGAIEILNVGKTRYFLNDGVFIAAESNVTLQVRTQSLGTALFGQSGGFFVCEAGGFGKIAVSCFGSSFILDVEPGKDIVVDNAHVVAWDARLHYEISITSQSNTGFLGQIINTSTSNEGILLRFSGRGKVVLCSRNRSHLASWLSKAVSSAG